MFFSFFPELQTTVSVLALAWVAKNPNTSTVILGASKPEQITENLKAIEVIPKLTPKVLHEIEKILDNEPDAHVRFEVLFSKLCFFFFFLLNKHPFFAFSRLMAGLC